MNYYFTFNFSICNISIIFLNDKILLFFRNDGFFNYDGGWWVLPAGHIEQGETAMTAAIREAKEELDKIEIKTTKPNQKKKYTHH